MFVCPFMCPHLVRLASLISFIVIYGPLQLLASLVINTIWSFGYKYYLVILDDCTHYLWTFPLRLKSDTFSMLAQFIAHVSTQFGARVKAVQCDNGKEFDNSSTRHFLLSQGIQLRMSCPYNSS
jgi:hypothetical protein